MKDKFKNYLVDKFKQIAPTKNAMEYRNKMLHSLLDRAQELQIKGITDKDLIYNICIEELGDFDKTLNEFENEQIKTKETARKTVVLSAIYIATMLLLVTTYLIVGGVTKIWHPTWLIIVGGAFILINVASGFIVFSKNSIKPIVKRLIVAVNISLITVFLFLLLQLAINLNGSWQAFLILPMLLFAVDTIISFITKSKIRWFELPIFVEVFAVMLYVLLGLNIQNFWHPGWLLCLAGVLFAVIEGVMYIINKSKQNKQKETRKNYKQYKELDERYYTEWDDWGTLWL